jgi:hypothetical protein
MAKVVPGRFTADIDGDFVVFLIGMRVNKLWKVHKWFPVAIAMPRMLRWLDSHPQAGLLGYRSINTFPGPMVIHYWRSFEDLERFSRQTDAPHAGPWRKFVKNVGTSGDVGIWHETYKVRAGEYEAVYGNMPVFGLAKATSHVPVARRGESAGSRIGAPSASDPTSGD